MTVKITCRPNGPYLLEGDAVEILVGLNSDEIPASRRPRPRSS